MYNPISTYRLQFNKNFTFEDARLLTDYFHLLGIGTIYASPVFTATPGSGHGYDVTNPHEINPEIGTEEQLKKLSKTLKNKRIGWLQDIVPNHMAFNQHNKWLWDVLEKGKDSEYASVFDIDRQHPQYRSKLMVPFLGDDADRVIQRRELKLIFTRGTFALDYYGRSWPLRFESFLWLTEQSEEPVPPPLSLLLEQFQLEEKSPDYLFLNGEWERFKEALTNLIASNPTVAAFFDTLTTHISEHSDLLLALFNNQHYRPVYWKETEHTINYRRFFTVNDLICLRMEDEEVFNHYHREINRLTSNHIFNGLRIDHIDGLTEPTKYLSRLRELTGSHNYLTVEKILEHREELPPKWPVQGTTGYDFLGQVNQLFTRRKGMEPLRALYYKISAIDQSLKDVIYESKQLILNDRMKGELDNLVSLLFRLRILEENASQNFSRDDVKNAIAQLLLAFPVYRIYPQTLPLPGEERELMKKALTEALAQDESIEPFLPLFEELFFEEKRAKGDRDHRILEFLGRMMQLAGPLMAKGVEDTAMYRYSCFIAHNEVGDSPGIEGTSFDDFHNAMLTRQQKWPLTMNATSTHDTKRGEDVRARLNAITEFPEDWEENISHWMQINSPFRTKIENRAAPSPQEEYFIYQTLIGVLPFDEKIDKNFLHRISSYMQKVLREAKVNSAWNAPNEEWEKAVTHFINRIFSSEHDFLPSLLSFHRKTAHYGIFNSLSQLTLKCTCPGVPDIYRGTEMWDLTLVDPDNRQPVDFSEINRTLKNLKEHYSISPAKLFPALINHRDNGHIKLWLTHRLLRYRKENQSLFSAGEYIPLKVKGIHKSKIMAFARHHKEKWHLTILPFYLSSFGESNKPVCPSEIDWKNTRVLLPEEYPTDWVNIFTGRPYSAGQEISVSEIFEMAPVGILHADAGRKSRSAGVLMHITSLPGRFASGDFGSEAFRFVDFLKESGHSYWQVLPFTQTTTQSEWSPYSSPSAFAGNILFISPRQLAEESLISKKDLKEKESTLSDKADFRKALSIREELTRSAYENFFTHCSAPQRNNFLDFCEQEKYWIHDYALFIVLKKQFDDAPWNKWPKEFRDREEQSLQKFHNENRRKVELEKFRQYLFSQQWQELKKYANHHGIRIIGDVPIYVSYDNADVWSNPHLFKLRADKTMSAVAGVPPDYFSRTGQLWNMPVYNWKKIEKENFKWWVYRIRKNLELFDLVRLDHFRGFESFWEVPADEETAENGSWVKGPGNTFLKMLKKEFPLMPFIAEDLGEIDENVYRLRDEYKLPGMKVLQFSFGSNIAESVHSPHNHSFNSVVYTGTHDNNTARGWFQNEADKTTRNRLKLYTGNKVKSRNVHKILTRLAWGSQSKLSVIPVQDLLGKSGEAQMNKPSVAKGNWSWRLKTMDELNAVAGEIRELLNLFAR
ncbi:malto-oligosyltrehalose synthase [Marinilabilia sp.]|uniref:malto-oligosyltrehalose synthase n=1 Tax=Marinilabilia sp. TaxID=2021252 RepID=UPI0025C18ABB|nr:malto-oligosyltrehalose synthase [Marinilabilia sp.]